MLQSWVRGLKELDPMTVTTKDWRRGAELIAEGLRLLGAGQVPAEPERDPQVRPGDYAEVIGPQRQRRRQHIAGLAAAPEPTVEGSRRLREVHPMRKRAALRVVQSRVVRK